MPLTELEQLARIFGGFATGLAVLVGTVWAIVRFMSPREVAQARVALELNRQELQPVVDLTMRATDTVPSGDDSWVVVATVVARNQGKKTARMAYEDGPPLTVYRLDEPKGGKVTFTRVAREPVRQAAAPRAAAPRVHRPTRSDAGDPLPGAPGVARVVLLRLPGGPVSRGPGCPDPGRCAGEPARQLDGEDVLGATRWVFCQLTRCSSYQPRPPVLSFSAGGSCPCWWRCQMSSELHPRSAAARGVRRIVDGGVGLGTWPPSRDTP